VAIPSVNFYRLEPVDPKQIVQASDKPELPVRSVSTTSAPVANGATKREYKIGDQLSHAQKTELNSLLREYDSVFEEPSIANVEPQKLPTVDNEPIRIQKRRPIPHGMIEHLKKTEAKWEEQGIIEDVPIDEAEYAGNLCFAPKKCPESNKVIGIRTCIDLRVVNEKLKSNTFPLPRQDELLSGNISKAKYFSSLDLCQFFHQIPIEKSSRKFVTFYASSGIKRFRTMAFGLKVASQIGQALLSKAFNHLNGICLSLFVDDIVIYSREWKEHMDHLRQVMMMLDKLNLKATVNIG